MVGVASALPHFGGLWCSVQRQQLMTKTEVMQLVGVELAVRFRCAGCGVSGYECTTTFWVGGSEGG